MRKFIFPQIWILYLFLKLLNIFNHKINEFETNHIIKTFKSGEINKVVYYYKILKLKVVQRIDYINYKF